MVRFLLSSARFIRRLSNAATINRSLFSLSRISSSYNPSEFASSLRDDCVGVSRNRGSFRSFCNGAQNFDDPKGPSAIDYRSLLQEDEFHRLADQTMHDLLQNFEDFFDAVQIDGFDIDYGDHVLTLKLGSLGTYVINKQTPNRQIWLSSPVSGPSRFDWDETHKAWVYRRTKANLLNLLETEIHKLCGTSISLS